MKEADNRFRDEREEIVSVGVKASIAAAKALHEIHSYKDGMLWRSAFPSFEAYCRARWEYAKAHCYRLVECGAFVSELESQSPNGDSADWMPKSEGHVRPLLTLPPEHQVECWRDIMTKQAPDKLTGKFVGAEAKKYARDHGIAAKPDKQANIDQVSKARREVGKLRAVLAHLPCPACFEQPLRDIEILIDQQPPDSDDTTLSLERAGLLASVNCCGCARHNPATHHH